MYDLMLPRIDAFTDDPVARMQLGYVSHAMSIDILGCSVGIRALKEHRQACAQLLSSAVGDGAIAQDPLQA